MLYNQQGQQVTSEEWVGARVVDNTIKREHLNGMFISTVFVGVDMGYGDGPPLIYETMVFPDGEWIEEYSDRYSTEEEALAGHARAIEWVKENY
jgi:hypothetical protein